MKNRWWALFIAFVLMGASMACALFETTPEPAADTATPPPATATLESPTAVPTTETPSTSTPRPTPTVRPKGTALQVVNDSDQEIWYLYVSRADAEEWGEDQLGADTIPPGGMFELTDIPDGTYDMQARNENDEVIQTTWEFQIAGTTTWRVSTQTGLEIVNNSIIPIGRLYVSPIEADTWGSDVLAGETIPVGGSFLVQNLEAGAYDLRAEAANEDLIEIAYNVEFQDEAYWEFTGKTELPSNAVLRFEDDFTDNRNSWGDIQTNEAVYNTPAGGEYCIDILVEDLTAWEWYEPFRPDEFIAEVACYAPAEREATCGLGFGPDGDNLYWFEVSPSDQTYALFLLLDDEWQPSLIDWTVSKNIAPDGWNFLSLERVNGVVSVLVNGVLQGAIESDYFPTGRIGLGGATYSDSNVTICLDNLRVWRLE